MQRESKVHTMSLIIKSVKIRRELPLTNIAEENKLSQTIGQEVLFIVESASEINSTTKKNLLTDIEACQINIKGYGDSRTLLEERGKLNVLGKTVICYLNESKNNADNILSEKDLHAQRFSFFSNKDHKVIKNDQVEITLMYKNVLLYLPIELRKVQSLHEVLGHAAKGKIENSYKHHNIYEGTKHNSTNHIECAMKNIKTKQHQGGTRMKHIEETEKFEELNIDILQSEYHFYVLEVTDSKTLYSFVKVLITKSDTGDAIKSIINEIITRFNATVKRIRADNALELGPTGHLKGILRLI